MAEDLEPALLETANGNSGTHFTFVRTKTDSVGQLSAPSTPDDSDNVSANGNQDDQDDRNDTPTNIPPRMHPRFSRAFSVPQLGRLQNPHRPRERTPPNGQSDPGTPSSPQLYELSLELADMVQMAIQTLLQISPPQVLDTNREQFSACALSVPTPSMSAMFTAMRNLNYFSANMAAFWGEPPGETGPELIAPVDFDLGELLQSVGDVMSGAAAEAGVDLVLYHGDLSLKYAWVRGSESGLTVALSHVLRQVISVASPGDSIEVGLFIGFAPPPGQEITDDLVQVDDALTESPTAEDGPIHCTIQIAHKFAAPCEARPEPHFSSLVLRRLLRQLGGSLASDLPSSTAGRICELSLTLDRAVSGSAGPAATPTSTDGEPTLEELAAFAETLKGAKVALYASSKGSFAQHVTRYLAEWGMDVSHMSGDGDPEHENLPRTPDPPLPTIEETPGDAGAALSVESKPHRVSFVFIDDDVAVLKERLTALRMEQPYHLTLNPKRPPLQHARRSTTQVPQIPRVSSPMPTSPVVIVHFTSLGNFKIVKDVLQSILASYLTPNAPALPEVMIVPKPAGPQRVLTQLHMAVTKPTVDPFFSPIATAPSTPGLNSVFSSYTGRSPAASNRPTSARSNSGSSRSGVKDVSERPGLPPPSPLGKINSTEYFSDDGVQLGSTPSSGRLIQSPPGQPSGIFFAPRSKTPKKSAFAPTMERDNGQLILPASSRRTSISRVPSDNPTFSSLHEESSSPRIGDVPVTSESVLLESPGPPITVRTDIAETSSPRPKSPVPSPSPTFRRPMRRRTATPDPKVLEKTKATPEIDIVPPISVLIVEDNVVNQMQLAGFMRKKKIKFEKANNGLEAVEKWKTGNFDLILMDIQMPVMDGIEATKEIRRLEKLNAAEGYPPGSPVVPEPNSALSISPYSVSGASPYRSSVIIVAQTASSLQSDRVKALAAGCNDFLTKPVSHHWLNNKVTEWGSIKALQMWADVPPPPGQNGTTQVAEQLHIPESGKRAGKIAAVVSADRLSPDKPSPITPGFPEHTNHLDSASKEVPAEEPSTDVPDVLPDDTPSLRR
ncbi:hypothetical protein FB45DRAFT_902747 [Roridomyces roridus]|uniref:Response regulatory domain-containing protein n=1 Tax=Roridomyces roridus TaxID=1738132 RepID=A0AAD7C3U8_9AGAR|nr:hypothetical protein FB45DRAFT_902747 [Roridomyces roridus]